MRKTWLVAALALVGSSGFGQGYTISTIVGAGWDIPGLSANLPQMEGLATDSFGNVFLTLTTDSVVLRLNTSGQLSLVAGDGIAGFSGDGGPAALAELSGPTGIAVDSAGNLYIEDAGNGRIRMVSNGVITTVAGGGTGDDGPALGARLNFQFIAPGIAADNAGSIYFADFSNLYRIRKLSNGILSTVAGGGFSLSDNIPATSASISAQGVAADSAGNVYFADPCAGRIRKVSNGTLTTVAGNGQENFDCAAPVSGPATGNATSVGLDYPRAVSLDPAGNLYFTEGQTGPFRIRKVSNGNITTVAGGNSGMTSSGPELADNIPATSATLELFVFNSIALDTAGNLYIPDEYLELVHGGYYDGTYEFSYDFGRLRKVSNGVITTVAGSNTDSGPIANAHLNLPAGVALDSAGNLYIGDSGNDVLREVSGGQINTIAGLWPALGGCGCASGPPLDISLGPIWGVAVDSAGNVYLADGNAYELSRSQGVLTPLPSFAGTQDLFRNVALDASGNLYFADWSSNQIQKLSGGVRSTIAGNGTQGFSGDNGPATSAELSGPSGIAVDDAGNVYFADTGNQRVRKISSGVITTVAGNGTAGFTGDNGPATSAELNLQQGPLPLPSGIVVDGSGNLFIVDSGNQRVRMVSNGTITTIAGTGTPGYNGDDGLAVDAQLNNPSGIAIDPEGKLYVSDSSNGRIRVLANCSFTVSPLSVTAPASGGSFPITVQSSSSYCSWSIAGLPSWITTSGTSSSSAGVVAVLLVVAPNTGASRSASVSMAGQPVLITQAGAPPVCTYAVSPSLVELPPSGGTFTITIQTGPSCSWLLSGLPTWILLPPGLPPPFGSASIVLTVSANMNPGNIAHLVVGGQPITVTQGPAAGSGPVIASITTAGSEIPVIAPNTWVEIKGPFLGLPGDNRTWQSSDFVNNQMPTQLDGIGVAMNGESAYVSYISFNQINVLTPPDLAPGPVQVIVTVSTVSSPPFTNPTQIEAPSLFVFNGGPYVAAEHAGGSLIGPTSLYPGMSTPAAPGEIIQLYANGFGPTNVPVVKGSLSQSGTLSPLPAISIGGLPAAVSFAGLVGPGEFQFNVAVPPSLANGDQTIIVTYGGQTQPGTLITVHN